MLTSVLLSLFVASSPTKVERNARDAIEGGWLPDAVFRHEGNICLGVTHRAVPAKEDRPGEWLMRWRAIRPDRHQDFDTSGPPFDSLEKLCGKDSGTFAALSWHSCHGTLSSLLADPTFFDFHLPSPGANLSEAINGHRDATVFFASEQFGCARTLMSSDGALRAWTVREARRGSDYIKTNLLRGEAYLQWKTSANTIDYSRDGDRDDLLLDSVVDLFEPLPGKRRLWILGGYAPLGLDLTRFLEVIEIGTGEPLAVESAFLIDGVPHSALLFQGPSRETGQPQHSLMHSFRARFDRTSSCIVFEPRPNRSESVDLMARRYRTLRLAAWRDGQFHSKSPAWGPLRLSASQCVADCRRNQ